MTDRPKRILLLAPLALVAIGLAACGGGGAAKLTPNDVAVVGSQHITQAMFAAAMAEEKASLEQQGQKFPAAGSSQYEQVKSNVLGVLVQQAELRLQAQKLGVAVTPAQVSAKLAQVKKKYFGNDEKRYEAGLKQQGFTDAQYRAYIGDVLLQQALYTAVTKKANTTKAQIAAYYQANLSQYQQAATRSVQEILVGKGKGKQQLASRLYDQLQHGASFAALAKRYSKDPGSKNQGGKFTATQGQDVSNFDKAVFSPAAKTGVLLKPVYTPEYGWFLIQPLAAIQAGKSTSQAKAAKSIGQQLTTAAAQEMAGAWMTGVARSYCSGGKIAYQSGYTPSPDPCAVLSSPNQTTT